MASRAAPTKEITVKGNTYSLVVSVNETTYSLVEAPPEDSKIVQDQESRLLGAVDLQSLVKDLGNVGKFVRIAYNGVVAAGPKFAGQQVKIHGLGLKVTKLCDKSAVTVAKFKNASGSILVNLKSTYSYLLDNLEEMAVITLSSVAKLAGTMKQAASELQREFEEKGDEVNEILEQMMLKKGEQAIVVLEMDVKRKKMEEQQKRQKEILAEAVEHMKKANEDLRVAELKEEEAVMGIIAAGVSEQRLQAFRILVNGLTTSISQFGLGGLRGIVAEQKPSQPMPHDQPAECQPQEGLVAAAEKMAERRKANRCEALELANKQREIRSSALQKLTEFACTLAECTDEREMADAAVGALHQAMLGLRQLSAIMMQAAVFWQQMQDHCLSLADAEMKTAVEVAMNSYSGEKRMEVWTSEGFKMQAVQFYAGWVALHRVCTTYVEQIKLTRKDLYAYIEENPTYEESREALPKLAGEFAAELKTAQKDIEKESFVATKEIEDLKSSAPARSDVK